MGFWMAAAPYIASAVGAAASGLMSKGGGGTTQESSSTSEVPEWLKPYLTGGDAQYGGTDYGRPPLSDDWIQWNTAAGQGYPVGPPPPMFVDDPRFTGKDVYEAPSTWMPMQDNIAMRGMGGMPEFGENPLLQMGQGLMSWPGETKTTAASPPGGAAARGGGLLTYPSERRPEVKAPVEAPVEAPVAAPPDNAMDYHSLAERERRRHWDEGPSRRQLVYRSIYGNP
jgi:hypothetical protein